MKTCPFCAEEIQDAAIRCKHCRSDLVPAAPRAAEAGAARPRAGRGPRFVVLAACLALVVGAPVVAVPLMRAAGRDRGCEPSGWVEWHAAMQRRCLRPAYVCEHMTTQQLLRDPEVAGSMGDDDAATAHLSGLVGQMRRAYGCAPEPGRGGPSGDVFSPAFPGGPDSARSL